MLQQIGRYEIKGELGRGGMATVYLAYDPRFQREVAIKVLPRQLTHDPKFLSQFEQEARMIGGMEDPAIVPVYDFGEFQDAPYLVMRNMSGGSLRSKIRGKPMGMGEVTFILDRLAPALDEAHKKGIIHRDLKPDNVLFDAAGRPYLADFGIARLAKATQTMTIAGTPAYMSPEQVRGDQKLDGRSDVYALGVILFEMLTGSQPFEADTPTKQMLMHILEPVPNVLSANSDLTSKAQIVIDRSMAKDRDMRYQRAIELADAFRELEDSSQASPIPISDYSYQQETVIDTPAIILTPASAQTNGNGELNRNEPPSSSIASGGKRIGLPAWVWWFGAIALVILLALSLRSLVGGERGSELANGGAGSQPISSAEATSINTPLPTTLIPAVVLDLTNTPTATLLPIPTATATVTPTPSPQPTHPSMSLVGLGITSPDWPMAGHDAAGTGFNSAETTLSPPLELLWKSKIPDYIADELTAFQGDLAVSGMETTESLNQVYMLDAATGEILWDFILTGGGGGAMDVVPVFGAGNVYFGGQGDEFLYAVDVASGELFWKRSGFIGFGLYASNMAFVGDNQLLVPDYERGVVAYDVDQGTGMWGTVGSGAWGLPAVARNGMVFGVQDKKIIALNAEDGAKIWEYSGQMPDDFPWIIVAEEDLFIKLSETELAALNINDGKVKWETTIKAVNALGSGQPALADDILYLPVRRDFVNENGNIVALDANTGDMIWNFDLGAEGVRGIAVANGVVYTVGGASSKVYALDAATGEEIWSQGLGSSGSGLVIANGVLYAISSDTVYAFGN